jgi:phosphoribosylformylglycinamidine cyclo-ligase
MCHITGGGLLNFKRISPYGFTVDTPITPPEIFSWIQKTGNISTIEMYRTFNMGMGFAYVVPKDSVAGIQNAVKGSKIVGEITGEPGAWLRDIEII